MHRVPRRPTSTFPALGFDLHNARQHVFATFRVDQTCSLAKANKQLVIHSQDGKYYHLDRYMHANLGLE